jgi:DNA-binding NtrC family response regulator
VAGDRTESVVSGPLHRHRADWVLVVAMDCQALELAPERVSLAGMKQLSIGRGAERKLATNGSQGRLDLADRWISLNHARLVRNGDRWTLEDEGSRNGSRVNGERVERQEVVDGDVLECGGTYLVLRRTDRPLVERGPLGARPEALRTMSPGLDHELDVLRKVARSPIPVLILGESGTGKEGMAKAIHALSGRDGPIVAVNCGAIPATLIESELFGSRKGAFSGAEERAGLIRSADGGTLFLDEVGELPLASQAALLRVLQEKQLMPLGGTRAVPVDVRVVAATNRPPADLADEGKFRRDLYARLRGYELRLPPLRERREDLGLLVAALVQRHDPGGGPRALSRAAASALFAHDWPLNIRELEQALSAALTVAGSEIDVEHLPRPVLEGTTPRPASAMGRDRLIALIHRHGGNLSAVARELATSRSQLYRLLTRHAIGSEDLKPPTPTTREP